MLVDCVLNITGLWKDWHREEILQVSLSSLLMWHFTEKKAIFFRSLTNYDNKLILIFCIVCLCLHGHLSNGSMVGKSGITG